MSTQTFDMKAMVAELERDEGRERFPYEDSGKVNVGVGRNLTDMGLRPQEIDFLLSNDILSAAESLDTNVPWWRDLDPVRQRVLVNMCFNLGWPRLATFTRFLAAAKSRNWEIAVAEMANSRWAAQVGVRARRLQAMMLTG